MQRFLKTVCLASAGTVAMVIGCGASAHAALLGDSVGGQFDLIGVGTLLNQTATAIDPGVEFTLFGNQGASIALDVKDDAFDIIFNLETLDNVGFPSTWTLSDLDWVGFSSRVVSGLSLTSGDASLISSTSFTDDSVTVNFTDIFAPPASQVFSFDIQTSDAAAIPTPALLPGLIGFGMSIVRKKRKQEATA